MGPRLLTKAESEIITSIETLNLAGDNLRFGVTVREVRTLCPRNERAYTTIQTIMDILVRKGFLQKKKVGRINFYKIVPAERIVYRELRDIALRWFNGSLDAMISTLEDMKRSS